MFEKKLGCTSFLALCFSASHCNGKQVLNDLFRRCGKFGTSYGELLLWKNFKKNKRSHVSLLLTEICAESS